MQNYRENSTKHPEIRKYLDKNGHYNPHKSEAIREEYKDERAKHRRLFIPSVSNIWEKIFPTPALFS